MLRLGRLPRKHNPRIPCMSALRAQGPQLPAPPLAVDYTQGMPEDFGMMYNDQLGDCTCAALYHARQVWTFNAAKGEVTESDTDVLQLYEEACGYDPSDPTTDKGGVEQDVLGYLLKNGMPIGSAGAREKIIAFLEVDFRNLDDVKRTINSCGVCYVGILVPKSVIDNAADPTIPWDAKQNDTIEGGHAVVLVGYDMDGFTCISWGQKYRITVNFLAAYLEEGYAIVSPDWVDATGKTPLHMSVQELESLMQEMRNAQ